MPRTALTAQTLKAATDTVAPTAGQLDLVMTAADVANSNAVPFTGKEILLMNNTDVGAQTITITSAPDLLGRTRDIAAYSMAAGKISAFDANTLQGWLQADGNLYFQASSALVKFAVLRHS